MITIPSEGILYVSKKLTEASIYILGRSNNAVSYCKLIYTSSSSITNVVDLITPINPTNYNLTLDLLTIALTNKIILHGQ